MLAALLTSADSSNFSQRVWAASFNYITSAKAPGLSSTKALLMALTLSPPGAIFRPMGMQVYTHPTSISGR